MKLRSSLLLFAFIALQPAFAASKKEQAKAFTISGTLLEGNGYTVMLVSEKGEVKSSRVTATGSFSFKKVSPSFSRNGTLQLVSPAGNYFGPIVLKSTPAKVFMTLSGKLPKEKKALGLGRVELKNGYAKLKKAPGSASFSSRAGVPANEGGAPRGAGNLGLVVTAALEAPQKGHAEGGSEDGSVSLGTDPDLDGIISALDSDDDGDGTLDSFDADSAETTASENPYSTLVLPMHQSLNLNIGAVTQEQIDSVIGGENMFALTFFFGLPSSSTATGGHVLCSPSLPYCRSTADGGGTAIFAGLVESDQSLVGTAWTSYNRNGSGYPNLEPFSMNGHSVLAASIQPRVGPTQFRAGDVYNVEFTNSSGSVVSTKTMSLTPYFVTVPALASYNVGSGEVMVDYASGTPAGYHTSQPIQVGPSGTISVNVWRPQRQTVGTESGSYRDIGHLHYGLVIETDTRQIGCGGHYSSLSSTLTENTQSTGPEGGQNLYPLDDSSSDSSPDAANVLSFTVNLSSCLTSGGGSSGTYRVTLVASGEELSGGSNRASQMLHFSIP